MMAATERRDVRVIIAETRQVLDMFEERLNEFSGVLDDLEAETQKQLGERPRRKGWL